MARALQPLSFCRSQSVAADAEPAELLTRHAARPNLALNLSTLLSFGRPPTPDSILQSVSYVLSELPRRLATRVRSFESLPFIVGTNPYVATTLNAYRESFKRLVSYPPVRSINENAEFAACLEVLVQNHANDIPSLAKGYEFGAQLSLSSTYSTV
jgi:26S proteasome regulatory subunit T1